MPTIKNNNPGNLRISADKWRGSIPTQTPFVNFSSLEYGVRANLINMRTLIVRDKKNTVGQLISTWAPESDNNKVVAYVNYVTKRLNVNKNWRIPWYKPYITKLLQAMTRIEHGTEISLETVERGWSLMEPHHKKVFF